MSYVSVKDESGAVKPGLLFSHCQWGNLYGAVTKPRQVEEEIKQTKEERERRRLLSKQMADTWENTYINIRKQRFEKRKQRLLKEQKYKEKRYEQLRKESEKVKKKICEKAKEMFFFERDACKMFHSAYRTSETEAERLAQLEFNEKLRKIDREIETKYAESVLNDVQRYHEEQEEERRNLEENKKKLKVEAKNMFKEAEARKLADKKRRQMEEKEDMEILSRQMQQVIDNENNEKLQKKLFMKQSLTDNREQVKMYKALLKEEEEEENRALEIIANGKIAMAKIRKEREEQMKKSNTLRYEGLSKKLSNEAEERERKEQESLRRAEEEKYRIEMSAKEKERQLKEMLKQERINEHLKYMKEQEEKLIRDKELLKWEILKRFEREEINNQFSNKQKEKKAKQAQEFKEECTRQVKLDIEKKIKERQIDLEACQRAQELWELGDKEFLEYAMKVREESKRKGRPLYPLDTAIYNYQKNYGVTDKNRNFIWDAKIKRPKGIENTVFSENKEEQLSRLEKCLTVNPISREDCGCPRKANGLR